MGRVAAILVALALGLASAFLVACGDRNKLLPQSDASAINGQLDSVASAVAAHDCSAATDAINAARLQAENLPSKVDSKLRRDLQANLEQVASNARAQCTGDDDPQHAVHHHHAHPADADADHADRDHPDRDHEYAAADHEHRAHDPDHRHRSVGWSRAGQRRPAESAALMAEEFIAGRYRLDRRLGIGGMSTVRLAFDTNLEREVAVKLLAEHLAEDDNFVSRFRREALAAARLVHPNIVQVFDFGLDERTGQHYIVMEYVPGSSCAEILREQKVLPVDEAVPIVGAGLSRPRSRSPQRRRAPRRQAREPAALRRRRRQAGRLRHRQGHRAVEHHAGRLRARYGRLPGARAGARRGGGTTGGPVRPRRRHLPDARRTAAVRGHLADRAGLQAAARDATGAGRAQPRRSAGARPRRGAVDGARSRRALSQRAGDGRERAKRRPGHRATGAAAGRRPADGRHGDARPRSGAHTDRGHAHAAPAAPCGAAARGAAARDPAAARRRRRRAATPRGARAASCAG